MLLKKREGMSKTPVSNNKIGGFPSETMNNRINEKDNAYGSNNKNNSSVDEQEVMQNAVKVINRIVS